MSQVADSNPLILPGETSVEPSNESSFESSRSRTKRTHKNIYYSFVIKGINILCQLILVPLTLNYLDKTQYGIWLTLASVIGWLTFFDIGIGNGLRNKLAEAIAKNDIKQARFYVSTAYAFVGLIFSCLMIIFWLLAPHINWSDLFNIPPDLSLEISKLVIFVFSFTCIQFILTLISSVLFAHQKAALSALITPVGNILSLITIYILSYTTGPSLLLVGIVFSGFPLVVLLVFNIVLFNTSFKYIIPNRKFIKWEYAKDLLNIGGRFLVIQIGVLVQLSTANIILAHLYLPETVTIYNIAFKYFAVGLMIAGIIMAPFWSAFTEAFAKNDLTWIKTSINKLLFIVLGLILFTALLYIISDYLIRLWVQQDIVIEKGLKLSICAFVVISLLAYPFTMFINGTGKITLQFYGALISMIITIPLCFFYCDYLGFGPAGIALAMISSTLPMGLLLMLQYFRIISQKASGIWAR